jgi:hypothetical protein
VVDHFVAALRKSREKVGWLVAAVECPVSKPPELYLLLALAAEYLLLVAVVGCPVWVPPPELLVVAAEYLLLVAAVEYL